MTCIKGYIVNPDSQPFLGYVLVDKKTGLISKVLDENSGAHLKPDYEFGKDCLIFPGMVDVHIHAREDQTGKQCYKEDYWSALNSALNGGVVMVMPMPNTPRPLTTIDDLVWHRARLAHLRHPVSALNYVGIGPGTKPIQGIRVPYKVYTGPSVGDLFFKNSHELRESLRDYRGADVSFHVEDFDVLMASVLGKNHSERRPIKCVEAALEYTLQFIEDFELDAKLCHWSTGDYSFRLIEDHRDIAERRRLPRTRIEVSPEHLLFDSDHLNARPELWPLRQMNPSPQGKRHRLQLIDGLRCGFIDMLATDHAPHSLDEKFKVFTIAGLEAVEKNPEKQFTNLSSGQVGELKDYILKHPDFSPEQVALNLALDNLDLCRAASCEDGTSGAAWLDTYALVAVNLMTEHNFSPGDIARVTAGNPGVFANQFLGIDYGRGFGKIEEGYQGSLTVINMSKETVVERGMLQTKAGWSPLEGETFKGGLEAVIIRGERLKKS